MFDLTETWYHHCKHCGFATSANKQLTNCTNCNKEFTIVGPCFGGLMQDKEILEKMSSLNQDEKIKRKLSLLLSEAEIDNVGFFDSHLICEKHGGEAPKISFLIEELKKKDFQAAQSSTLLIGIKTNASFKTLLELFNTKE
jgi:tRNA G26 N,N-dimethylase Trm1